MDTTHHTPNGNGGRLKGIWRRLSGRRSNEGSISETLSDLAAQHTEDATPIDPLERALLENTLKLRRMTIEDVMVPRADIVALSAAAPLEEVVAAVEQSRHSRLPVFEKDLDRIVGMIHVKDVLAHIGKPNTPSLKDLAREVLFVSPAMLVLDLLLEMRIKRTHMALVVDEFGGIDGLATIEDLVEEIVGDIEDEHDIAEPPQLEARPDGTLVADARATLEDFEAAVGEVLTDDEREDLDTLGGLVFNLVGRVPSRG
ncbi:MAG: hemolysin family protein, partial [Alphaproteobacteria bacterium]|nr:hemolysin family protein [Alphaproteobacteria bacterium]